MDTNLMDRAVEAYSASGNEADKLRLEFFAGLYRLEQEWAERVKADFPYLAPSAEQVEAWYWAYEAVLSHAPVLLDGEVFPQTLSEMADYLAEHAGLEDEAAEALRAFDWQAFAEKADLEVAGRDPATFVDACLGDLERLGVESTLPASLFGMVLTFALRAWLQPAAEAAIRLAPQDHTNHNCPLDCPICGTPATASFVGEAAGTDGRGRMQYCAVCGSQWQFERIRCGACGTHNQGKLHYFNLEGDNAHRIQNCEECGQYQRVVFQEDLPGPLCMEVEDVVMAKLDYVALDPRFTKEVSR